MIFSQETSNMKKPQPSKPMMMFDSLTVDKFNNAQNGPKWLKKITARYYLFFYFFYLFFYSDKKLS